MTRTFIGIDLGSNAFRFHVFLCTSAAFSCVFSERAPVRIGLGLAQTGSIAQERLRCAERVFHRFSALLAHYQPERVVVYATSAVRSARNQAALVALAEGILGCTVCVLTPQEEAYWIYQGTCYAYPAWRAARLVIDIGGGSTECILGIGQHIIGWDSLPVGCLSLLESHLGTTQPIDDALVAARARAYLASLWASRPDCQRIRTLGHVWALGCSGSVRTVLSLLGPREVPMITLADMRAVLARYQTGDPAFVEGLTADQARLLLPCVLLLEQCFLFFRIESLYFSSMDMVVGGLLSDVLSIDQPDFFSAGWVWLAERLGVGPQGQSLYQGLSCWYQALGWPEPAELVAIAYAYSLGDAAGWSGRISCREDWIRQADISGASPLDRQQVLCVLTYVDAAWPWTMTSRMIMTEAAWRLVCVMRLFLPIWRYMRTGTASLQWLGQDQYLCTLGIDQAHAFVMTQCMEEVPVWHQHGYTLSVIQAPSETRDKDTV